MSEIRTDKNLAHIALDLNFEKVLTYEYLEEQFPSLKVGMRVEVPLKGHKQAGTVLELSKGLPPFKTESIHKLLSEESYLTDSLLKLANWMIRYYCSNWTRVLRCFIPSPVRKQVEQKSRLFLEFALPKHQILGLIAELRSSAPEQATLLELLLHSKKGIFLTDLLKESGLTRARIQTLIKKKIIKAKEVVEDPTKEHEFFRTLPKNLHEEQRGCVDQIATKIKERAFYPALLFGITGSGKTEVYMQLMQVALNEGRSVLVLVPEVALTTPLIEKFRARFTERVVVLHHKLSEGEKNSYWEEILQNKARIVLGARSAIFCPIEALGLIIIDEEHDSSYKQSEIAPAYHARDVAIMRAKIESCPILLGSATPSLESYFNAMKGKYHLHLLSKRAEGAKLPTIQLIDMKRECEKQGGFTYFSSDLLNGIKERYEKGEQTLLFLNRRGYQSSLMCPSCSTIVKCPHCDLALTFHKGDELLLCHLCNYKMKPLHHCLSCKTGVPLKYQGFGTEKIERSLKALFPQIRVLRVDRDTTSRKDSHERFIKEFRSGKADVLIGTQMITKGFHFPSVTLVGIINIDGALQIPDFRSSEYCFQLLTQVAGRSGRGELPGEVILQSYLPQNQTIQLAIKQDYQAFYNQEIAMRELFSYPPFVRMVKLLFSGPDLAELQAYGESFHLYLTQTMAPTNEISPLVPSGYAKVKDLWKLQLLIKTKEITTLSPLLKKAEAEVLKKEGCSLFIDIDPLLTY